MIEIVFWEGTNLYPFFSAKDDIDVDIMMHMVLMKFASLEDKNEEDAVK